MLISSEQVHEDACRSSNVARRAEAPAAEAGAVGDAEEAAGLAERGREPLLVTRPLKLDV